MPVNRAESPASSARFVRPHGWRKKPTDEKNFIGAEARNILGKTNPAKKPADIMTRLRARRHNQKNHCQRNKPGDYACQCARNADRRTNLLKKKKLADWKKLTRKNDTAEKTIVGETRLRAKTKNAHFTSRAVFTPKRKTCGLTVCVTGAGAGVDSAWEQKKLEARKMLVNRAESPASSARFVGHGTWRLVPLPP